MIWVVVALQVLMLLLICSALAMINGIAQEMDALKDELYEGHYRPRAR